MFFWNSLAFLMIQRMLAIWSLVPLPLLKPAWTSGSSWFTYCWLLGLILLQVYESEKWKSLSHVPTFCNPMNYTVHGILQARILEWVAFPFSRGSSQPRDWPRSPTLWSDSLPDEPQGKPKNTGVGRLSLLQGIFPTQELNQDLLHCRWIFYQPNYQGSPICPVHCSFSFILMSQSTQEPFFLNALPVSFIFFFNFIYLAMPGLSCSMQILSCRIWDLVAWPGIKPRAPVLGHGVLRLYLF